ncbi:hypothetical protein BS50DRAFT_458396, partial [Corynespora cassiicola Philippines]
MAEVQGTISSLQIAQQLLRDFSESCQQFTMLPDRLLDISVDLHAADLSLQNWQTKYDVQDRRPIVYMHVLFGRPGTEQIKRTLDGLKAVARTIREDVWKIIGRALRAKLLNTPDEDSRYNKVLVKDCLNTIRRSRLRSRDFTISVLRKADYLEMRLDRLHRKLSLLERYSEHYLEKEHPDIYQRIRRLPGRRVILKIGHPKHTAMQDSIVKAKSARKDAELLYRASPPGTKNLHIGLAVPQIHPKDFAFLLEHHGLTREVLLSPKLLPPLTDPSTLPSTIPKTLSSLLRHKDESCYILPPDANPKNGAFQLSFPATPLLTDLEHKDPLSALLRAPETAFSPQILYPLDRCAVACGVASAAFRLLGSPWAPFLECGNVRWRRGKEGRWTCMMRAAVGDQGLKRGLERCEREAREGFGRRDLRVHTQVFRAGLVMAELGLKRAVSYVDFDADAKVPRIFVETRHEGRGSGRDGRSEPVEMDAMEIAAEVERETNLHLANMVFSCLEVLQEKGTLAGDKVEERFCSDVLEEVKKLE